MTRWKVALLSAADVPCPSEGACRTGAGAAGGGVAPGAGGWIWAISPSASNSCQRAMTCGPRNRKIAQPVHATLLPVAAMP